jgi:hypothetical protein
MISRKYLKEYSDIILEILNKFSEETTVKVAELMETDDRFLEMRRFIDQNPTEEEMISMLKRWENLVLYNTD